MKDRVVCIIGFYPRSKNDNMRAVRYPVIGEIYTVIEVKTICGITGYRLAELHQNEIWDVDSFRPVDDSFGEWVEATVLQEGILEEAEKELTI